MIEISPHQLKEFCRRNRIKKLTLFGSALRADFGPESDIDLLVEFEPGAQVGFLALNRMRRELEALLGRPVDLVPQEGLKPLIREHVLSTSEVVYAAAHCIPHSIGELVLIDQTWSVSVEHQARVGPGGRERGPVLVEAYL